MRPTRSTEAHQTADFAELVCSNSLKSESENTAPWLLKQEMRRAGSVLLAEADASAVPAGHALAVDRVEFSRRVAARIAAAARASPSTAKRSPRSTSTTPTPSPSSPPARSPRPRSPPNSQRLTGSDHLAFYDSISPIVDATTIDMDQGLLRRPLGQRHRRLHQLPLHQGGVRPLPRRPHHRRSRPAKAWEAIPSIPTRTSQPRTCPLLRRLPAHRRDRPPRPRHPPLRPHEARRPHRPQDRHAGPTPSSSFARRICAPTATTSSASRTTSSSASRRASSASSPASRTPPSSATARSTATPTSTRPRCSPRPSSSAPTPRILIAGQLSGVEGYTESIASGLLAGRYAAALAHGRHSPRPPRAPPPTAR